MTDSEFMLAALRYGPCSTTNLIVRSIHERGYGLTPHSRAADLRRQGHDIRCDRLPSTDDRPLYVYTLVQQPVQLELTG